MDTFLNNVYVIMIYEALAYLITAFVLFFIGKIVYQMFHRNINVKDELVEQDNLAFAIAHVGYFIGMIFAIGSAIIGPSKGLLIDIAEISLYGLLSILLLNISTILNDKLILRKFSVHKEIITDSNVGTGVVEAASAIASGLIIFGAVTGDAGGSLLHGIISALVFWGVGQVLMIFTARIYNIITSYDIHEHIEKDNIAVGIGFAGAMIAIANLIRHGLMGNVETWTETFVEVGIEVGIGFLFLPLVRLLTDKILLPGQKLTDEIINQEHPNIGASIIEAFAYIGGSVLITWCL